MELLELCCRLISKQGESATGEESHESRLTARLTSVLEHLIKSVELRILIPSLTQVFVVFYYYYYMNIECDPLESKEL